MARRSIAALRVSEGAEAFLRPAVLGSACAACSVCAACSGAACSVCAVGPLPWCCFLRQPLLHLRSLHSPVRRCEKMSIRRLAGTGACATVSCTYCPCLLRGQISCYKAPCWRNSPSFRVFRGCLERNRVGHNSCKFPELQAQTLCSSSDEPARVAPPRTLGAAEPERGATVAASADP